VLDETKLALGPNASFLLVQLAAEERSEAAVGRVRQAVTQDRLDMNLSTIDLMSTLRVRRFDARWGPFLGGHGVTSAARSHPSRGIRQDPATSEAIAAACVAAFEHERAIRTLLLLDDLRPLKDLLGSIAAGSASPTEPSSRALAVVRARGKPEGAAPRLH